MHCVSVLSTIMAYSVYFSGKVPKPQINQTNTQENKTEILLQKGLHYASVLSTITKHRSKYHGLLRILLRYSVENELRLYAPVYPVAAAAG